MARARALLPFINRMEAIRDAIDFHQSLIGIFFFLICFLCHQFWLIYQSNATLKHEREKQFQKWGTSKFQRGTLAEKLTCEMYPWLTNKSCLVTGGSGFLGRHVVECLVKLECKVTVLDLTSSFSMEKVNFIQGNLCNRADVERACTSGIDVVFHCATPNPFSPNTKLLHDVNIGGTKLLLEVCEKSNIKRFVFTSSASVVFDGKNQQNVSEDLCQTPLSFRDEYSLTKAIAEEAVLQHKGSMRTVAIRPHGIFGPRDLHFFPTLAENAKRGKTKFQIGDGKNVVDFTFVGNVVHGLFLAAEKLNDNSVNREPFFITNDSPLPFWDMLSQVLIGLGYSPPYMPLPYMLCYFGAMIAEGIVECISWYKRKPIALVFNRSKVQLAGLHHYYSCEKAKKILGYLPMWSMDEGLMHSFAAFEDLRKERIMPSSEVVDMPNFTKEEVAKHNQRGDAWIVVKNRVFDITEYVDEHPGGDEILNDAGGDATDGFYGPQHPPTVEDHLEFYFIGHLN